MTRPDPHASYREHVSSKAEAVEENVPTNSRFFPEDADERRMFDQISATLGGPLLVIANAAQIQARTMSIPGASFYEQGLINHNVLIKAHDAIEAYRKSAGVYRETIESLRAQLATARKALEAYEQWEADIILENKCWTGQNVRLTDELWDRLIEIQALRNTALNSGEQKQIKDWPYPTIDPTCAQDLK